MRLPIHRMVIEDDINILAKTAEIVLHPQDPTASPAIEFQLASEGAYSTPSNIRPDDQKVTLSLGTDGQSPHEVFSGLVDYIDDLDDPNLLEARLTLTAFEPGRPHRRRATAVYNDPTTLNFTGGTLPSGNFLENYNALDGQNRNYAVSYYRGLGGQVQGVGTLAGNPNQSFTAKELLAHFCGKVGMAVGSLDFPDYRVNGSYIIEHKTAPEVAQELLDPFNMFPYLQYTVRVYGNVLSVIGTDFTKTGNDNAFQCRNIKSIKRTFEAYDTIGAVGDQDIILTGGARPSSHGIIYKTEIRDIPDGLGGTQEIVVPALMEERLVEEKIVTKSSDAVQMTSTEVEATIKSYVLLTGYDVELPTYVTNALAVASSVIQQADNGVETAESLREYVVSVAQALQRALSGESFAEDIGGTEINEEGLGVIPPDAYSLQTIYDINNVPISAELVPSVEWGEVRYVTAITVLGVENTKTVTRDFVFGELISESEQTNEYEIFSRGGERKLLLKSSQTTQFIVDGSSREATDRENKLYTYDKYGDLVQTAVQVFTMIRNEPILRQSYVEITPKRKLEYRIQEFEDGQRLLGIGERLIDLTNKVNDEIMRFNDRFGPSGNGYIPGTTIRAMETGYTAYMDGYGRVRINQTEDWEATMAQNKLKRCMLVNGKEMTEDFFYANMPVKGYYTEGGPAESILPGDIGMNQAAQEGLRALLDTSVTKTAVGFKRTFPLFDIAGLRYAHEVIVGQQDLERLGAYWEKTTVEMTLDTTPVVGGYAVAAGASGRIVNVRSAVDQNEAITVLSLLKVVKR